MALTLTRTRESTQDDATTITPAATGKAQVDERLAAQRRAEALHRATTVPSRETNEMPAVVGPRPRASFMATMALMLGLGATFAVLTGLLVGVGVGLGLLATFAAIGGIAATSKHHVAGKGDALLGMLLGLASIVVGSLAMTGVLPWLDPSTDQVLRLHDWLDVRMPWLFPGQ
jgi:hypothetical protein